MSNPPADPALKRILDALGKSVCEQNSDRPAPAARGARIMAEMARIDTGKLDEALQIREAEKILQERARERGATKEKERDSGMER